MMRRCIRVQPSAPRRGLAALTVVMILFFVLAMAAAYTNRTLIVDQRSTTNGLRSAQAIEATEAGIEWAIAQLNGSRVTASCAASSASGDADFRSQYLVTTADGGYKAATYLSSGNLYPYAPACIANSDGVWTCSCPSGGTTSASLTANANGAGQVFRVHFDQADIYGATPIPGVAHVMVQGCSALGGGNRLCTEPLWRGAVPPNVDAFFKAGVWLGLVKALPYVPSAALTAGTSITSDALATLRVVNPDPSTGITLHSGAANSTPLTQLAGPAGTVGDGRLESDPALNTTVASGRLFQSLFGMEATNYSRQPGVVYVDCAAGCTSNNLTDALAQFPGRVIWVNGNLNLNTAATLGSAAQPMMLVSTGTVTLSATVVFNGLLYANAVVWNAGAATAVVNGAVVSATTFTANGNATIAYDAAALGLISRSYGSFVRIPGGSSQL